MYNNVYWTRIVYNEKVYWFNSLFPFFFTSAGKSNREQLKQRFGYVKELNESANQILLGLNSKSDYPHDLSSSLEVAHLVGRCDYEYGTDWGTKVRDDTCEEGLLTFLHEFIFHWIQESFILCKHFAFSWAFGNSILI